ncbi:MAG: adenylate/guanylate cyclase domain-containing protein [Desulfobacterales bacterium]|jgi:class 3 adenylate cyclase/tetratricopeptide (TPR) repeat protein
MECPQCQSDNREGVKFCEECGEKLELECPACQAKIPLEKKFCGECGHKLAPIPEALPVDYARPQSYTPKHLAQKILAHRSTIQGERKLVTVLFADVANYTAMSENLDPEEIHRVMDECFKILMDEIHRYEGTINQFTGDGIMALFGAPVAHEDHAQRACYAALSIQKAIGSFSIDIKRIHGIAFNMRIGLNSGPVIVGSIGDDLRMDYTAVGDTTNLAARIQQNAEPGEVWLSQATRDIVKNYFRDEHMGNIALKGKAEAQPIYQIIAERPGVRTRFDAGLVRGVTGLVGRDAEMEALTTAFNRAKDGEAQVVDVVGEAGVGKSRLVYEFQKSLDNDAIFLAGICIHYGRNINFLPLIDVVRAAFGIEEGITREQVGERIAAEATNELATMIPFYRRLLALEVEDRKFRSLSPEGRKFGTFEAVKNLFFTVSDKRPLVIFLEDVHWMDKVSEEFFAYLSRSFLKKSILMIAAYRPECVPSWAQGAHYQRLGLETLSSNSSMQLVRNILHGMDLETGVEHKIIEKTGGNPFFIEEIVRELVERGDLVKLGDQYVSERPIDQVEIPNTVQGVLAARMDRLSEDLKRTMQVASVIGRDFAFRLLRSIMELGEELRIHLANLVGLEILYEKALYPELEYIFKHALTQEVAYESLLKQRRREIHGRIARAIEELYADRLEGYYEVLAHHYEQSGNAAKAVDYLILAGEKSNASNAVQAADQFFQKARELMEGSNIELNPKAKVRLYRGMARASLNIGDIDTAADGFRRVIDISRRHGMLEHERKGMIGLTSMMFMWPKRIEAEQTMKEAIDWAQNRGDKELESITLSNLAHGQCTYGDLAEAHQVVIRAEQLAAETKKSLPIFTARLTRSFTERLLGSPQRSVELTEGMFKSLRKSFAMNPLMNVILLRGMALAEIGRIEDSIAIFMDGIELFEKLGASFRLGSFNNCLGYCYGEIHQHKLAWKYNLRSEEIVRRQMQESPMGRSLYGEILAQTNVNLMENLFDQGNLDAAWKRMESFRKESNNEDFNLFRQQWESRMNYLAAQILLQRGDLDRAERVIRKGIETAQSRHTKKREGSFLRLLGEIQKQRNETENAIVNLNKAIEILIAVGNPRQLWQAHASLARVFKKLGKHSEGREQWGMASEIIHQTAHGLSDRKLRKGFLDAQSIGEILSKAEG